MKNLSLLLWLTQLGLSVAVPLGGFILLGLWLHNSCGWGGWTVWAGIILGAYCAIEGFHSSLKNLQRMAGDDKQEQEPPVSFNDHE